MIRADELTEIGVGDGGQVVVPELTLEQQAQFYDIDADLEKFAVKCPPGKMFEARYPVDAAPVLGSIIHHWQAGGWVVGTFQDGDQYRLVVARPQTYLASVRAIENSLKKRQAEDLPLSPDGQVVPVASTAVKTSRPLLVRMPTRGRPTQALKVLVKYRELARTDVTIEVVIDEDDALMNDTRILQQLCDLDCVVTVGRHKNKIEACNGGRVDDWGVLLLASDDMVPVKAGYDKKILSDMERYFPLLDGMLCYNDGYNKDHVVGNDPITCTLPVMGRWLYEMHGRVVYHPGYKSIWCDSDQSFLFSAMNRFQFVDEIIVEHRHYANSKAQFDALYKHNERYGVADKETFEARKKCGFDRPAFVLSLLICSIKSRKKQLDRLVDYLRWQIREYGIEDTVEIVAEVDSGGRSVGEKRQRLLERATGDYVAFIDDDDWVSCDYIEKVVAACFQRKDCCSLVGTLTTNGENPERFEHSLVYDRWYTREDGVYIRTPNHLNAIRREIALQVGFVSKNVGEDHLFSEYVRPLLKSEASTGEEPIYYYWSVPNKSVQRVA